MSNNTITGTEITPGKTGSMGRRHRRRNQGFTMIEVMIVVVIIGILLNIAMPNLVRAREQTRVKGCVKNLKQIDAAKQQWAMENKQPGTAVPLPANLYGTGLYLKSAPQCPGGYTYTINAVDTEPTCSLGKLFAPYFHTFSGQ